MSRRANVCPCGRRGVVRDGRTLVKDGTAICRRCLELETALKKHDEQRAQRSIFGEVVEAYTVRL